MKTVLFATELGGGVGHFAPLLAIANRLTDNGESTKFRAVFSVRDPIGVRSFDPNLRYPLLPAPCVVRKSSAKSHTGSYVEVLNGCGFSKIEQLSHALAAWDDVFDLVQPDALVADHCPTACLAALGRIPTLIIGNGYTVPPADIPLFPALKAGMAPPTLNKPILQAVNGALKSRDRPPLESLPHLLQGDQRAIFTIPHLDPYGPLRREKLLGSYNVGLQPTEAPNKPHLFVYLDADEAVTNEISQVLATVKSAKVSAYLGSANNTSKVLLSSRGSTIFDKPPPLAGVLRQASVILSHGGGGLAAAAMTVGRPHIVIPIHIESALTAGRIHDLGVGKAIQELRSDILANAIDTVVEVKSFGQRSAEVAREIQQLSITEDAVGEAVDRCRIMLR